MELLLDYLIFLLKVFTIALAVTVPLLMIIGSSKGKSLPNGAGKSLKGFPYPPKNVKVVKGQEVEIEEWDRDLLSNREMSFPVNPYKNILPNFDLEYKFYRTDKHNIFRNFYDKKKMLKIQMEIWTSGWRS